MPKIVDHEARRRELAEAVWRVVCREGVEGASIRSVALESGWSTGALRHYFTTKQELIGYAARLVVQRVSERLQAMPRSESFREAVRAVVCEVLPLDVDRRTETAIWLAFVTRSLVDSSLEGSRQIGYEALHELCRNLMNEAAACGELAPGRDPREEAGRLHALLDGWALHGLMGWLDPHQLEAAVDAHLADVFVPGGGRAASHTR